MILRFSMIVGTSNHRASNNLINHSSDSQSNLHTPSPNPPSENPEQPSHIPVPSVHNQASSIVLRQSGFSLSKASTAYSVRTAFHLFLSENNPASLDTAQRNQTDFGRLSKRQVCCYTATSENLHVESVEVYIVACPGVRLPNGSISGTPY